MKESWKEALCDRANPSRVTDKGTIYDFAPLSLSEDIGYLQRVTATPFNEEKS